MRCSWLAIPGVALLLAGCDEDGPQLFHSDPSGTYTKYKAKAIGSGSEGAQTSLEESFHDALTLAEAETLALSTLKEVMEEKLDHTNVEMASVTTSGFRSYEKADIDRVIAAGDM